MNQQVSVKQQVIEDLQMAGLAPSTQRLYLAIIVRFVNRTRIRPQDATEAQVAEYLRNLINQGKCQGTVRPIRSALQFVFQNTLGRQWGLFKKGSPRRGASVCPMRRAAPNAAASSPLSARTCIGFV
jgi:hypothetical protein